MLFGVRERMIIGRLITELYIIKLLLYIFIKLVPVHLIRINICAHQSGDQTSSDQTSGDQTSGDQSLLNRYFVLILCTTQEYKSSRMRTKCMTLRGIVTDVIPVL